MFAVGVVAHLQQRWLYWLRYGGVGVLKGRVDYRSLLEDIEPFRTLARAGAASLAAKPSKKPLEYTASGDVVDILKSVRGL